MLNNAGSTKPRVYLNAALTANALLLGVIALHLGTGGDSLTNSAQAQPRGGDPEDGGRTNAVEQNKVMIAELRAIQNRMEHIETTLSRGLNVKVTEMPAGFGKENPKSEKQPEKSK